MTRINDDAFDDRMRQQHALAVAQVSARTQARLQPRRRPASVATERHGRIRGFAWPLAAACAMGLLVVGLQWRRPDPALPVAPPVASVPDDEFDGTYAALDEAPDLYVWLASSDAPTLAME